MREGVQESCSVFDEGFSDSDRVVWLTLLTLADADGVVRRTTAELAAEATADSCDAEPMPTSTVDAAIVRLGARLETLEPVGSGWRIRNYGRYGRRAAELIDAQVVS